MLKQFIIILMASLLMATSLTTAAEGKKKQSYTEDQFIKAFSGKSKKTVEEKLGSPSKKEQSVKPQGANQMLAKIRSEDKADSKENRVNVEMWYYDNIVNYDPKHTYKKTELTFVNDRCMNITFFNQ